jgi:hypothetical protein
LIDGRLLQRQDSVAAGVGPYTTTGKISPKRAKFRLHRQIFAAIDQL